MCFTPEVSIGFASVSLILAILLHRKFGKWGVPMSVTFGVLYFGLMEVIQAIQYATIDKCDDPNNTLWTYLGVIHILFQPAVIHSMQLAFAKTDAERARANVYVRFAIFAGASLFISAILARDVQYTEDERMCLMNKKINNDWLRSDSLCTRTGNLHLAWHIKMSAPAYWLPNSFIHSFAMFAPYFAENKPKRWIIGLLFMLTGPGFAAYLTDNVNEQAAVWCFFSIIQLALLTGQLLLPRPPKKLKNKSA